MLIVLPTLATQLRATWLVINRATASIALAAAWSAALIFLLLLCTLALLWTVPYLLMRLGSLRQIPRTQAPYDFWGDLRYIDDECDEPILRSRASMRYEAKNAS